MRSVAIRRYGAAQIARMPGTRQARLSALFAPAASRYSSCETEGEVPMPSRRETLAAALTSAIGLAGGVASPLGTMLMSRAEAQPRPRSADGVVPYGAAVRDDALANEPDYRAALAQHCRQIVGEGGLKWFDIRPTREQFVFDRPDRQIEFAARNGMELRGHTLAWYGAMPDWTRTIGSAAEAERELTGHIERVMGRYKGRIKSWDVINEPIPDDPASRSDIRPSIWQQRLGEAHIAMALRTAARTDPNAQLVINEYDIEFVGPVFRRKREAFLRLIRDLKLRNVPLHAVGFQAHLRSHLAIDREGVSAFVTECKAMGLDVLVTELDVIDDKLPGTPEVRDILVAAQAYDFLSSVASVSRPTAILTWGITDKHTWVPTYFRRSDGFRNRPLPLDENYRPKPLMRVIEHFARGGR
jgi:endo-1,4-beta-xylanase